MANALKELSAALREAVRRASAYTVGLDREPYSVSGVLIGGNRVLTASHLVPDEGVTLLMPEGGKVEAKVAGRDPIHDLALLRPASSIQAPEPATAAVEVGDLVIALKRDSFDGVNASLGMVSAVGAKLRLARSGMLERYLQIDADRLVGSTGGPLADAEGGFAGIQVFNRRMGAEVAIPADLALARAKILEEKGNVQRPYLGLRSQVVALPKAAQDALKGRQETGLLLVSVEKGRAAESAGLEVGDILVGIGSTPLKDHDGLVGAIAELGAGAKAEAEVLRGGKLKKVPLTVGGV